MMADDDADPVSDDSVLPDTIPERKNVSFKMLPEKSKRNYITAYNEFKHWHKSKNIRSFSEEIFLLYFKKLSLQFKPSTLWARYSMLKATLYAYNNFDMSKYRKLTLFLKKNYFGHKPKKTPVLSAAEVEKFCSEAPDETYLVTKVALVIGISGSCRRDELANLTTNDIEDHRTMLLIKIPKTNEGFERSFTITGAFYDICKKYISLRPPNIHNNRFFLNFQNGVCKRLPLGINKLGSMPKTIAAYLKLPNPELYSGHCFRRSANNLLSNTAANIVTRKSYKRWKSNKPVAEENVENSVNEEPQLQEPVFCDPDASSDIKSEPHSPAEQINQDEKPSEDAALSAVYQSAVTPVVEMLRKCIDSLSNQPNSITFSNTAGSSKSIYIEFNNCNITINMGNERSTQ